MRPLAAAIAQGAISPGSGATLALMAHINPKLAMPFGVSVPACTSHHHDPVPPGPCIGRSHARGNCRVHAKARAAAAAGRAAAWRVAENFAGPDGDRDGLGALGRRQQSVRHQGGLVVERPESRRGDTRVPERRARLDYRRVSRLSERRGVGPGFRLARSRTARGTEPLSARATMSSPTRKPYSLAAGRPISITCKSSNPSPRARRSATLPRCHRRRILFRCPSRHSLLASRSRCFPRISRLRSAKRRSRPMIDPGTELMRREIVVARRLGPAVSPRALWAFAASPGRHRAPADRSPWASHRRIDAARGKTRGRWLLGFPTSSI